MTSIMINLHGDLWEDKFMSGHCGLLTSLMKTLRNFLEQDEEGRKFGWQENLLKKKGDKGIWRWEGNYTSIW